MDKDLLIKALTKFLFGVIILGLLLFLPAGSLHYWQGWLLMGILFVPMAVVGIVMMAKNPELLRKRLNAKEKEAEQKSVVAMSGLLFVTAFVLAGLNWRFGWWVLPNWVVWVSAGLFLASYLLYAEVMRENTYLSRTVEVQDNQKVIDTGLYGIVRHPMYMATTVMFLTMPLVLGSPISFLIMLGYIPVIAKRIKKTRDESMIVKDDKGRTVNRLETIFWMGTSHASNEECACIQEALKGLGIASLDHQARV